MKELLPSMNTCMNFNVPFLCESFVTMAAIIRFFASVSPPVYIIIPFFCESFVTMAALNSFFPSVTYLMYSKFPFHREIYGLSPVLLKSS